MTREEQIKEYCSSQGFPYGACSGISSINAQVASDAIRWADKTMIDKACEWLESELYQHKDRDGYPNVESRSYTSVEDLIKDFKRYMEE